MRILNSGKIRLAALLCVAAALLSTIAARGWIEADTDGRIFKAATEIPNRRVGLVLGCSPHLQGTRPNFYFLYRVQAARELFDAGKIDYLLVSGDNHIRTYDEAGAMKAALVGMGIPAERIVCDYAGFSTLDSVVRAREVFGQDRITIISQRFHVQRAVFIARRKGLDAVGYCAQDLTTRYGLPTRLREQLARVKTVLDLYLLRRQPRFLGPPVIIGEEPS